MWLDISPFIKNRDFRFVYTGQFVSFFGTMISLVALPFQIYELTHSTLAVGLLGIAELIPLLMTAFIGGALADVMDRKTLLIRAEIGLTFCCLLLVANAFLNQPQVWLIFVVSALMSALNGLHRPSLDAMLPRLVNHHEIESVSVLVSLKGTVGMIGGPAIAGLCIARFGLPVTYIIDCLTFVFSILALSQVKSMVPPEIQAGPTLQSVKESLLYAKSRQDLLGTYLVDLAAMIFAMPNALFPAIASLFGGTKVLGWLYSAPAVGALFVTLFSGWTKKVKRHGVAVIFAAVCWGLAIMAFGLSHHLGWALFFLGLAGAADCVSAIFRTTIWNETIPDKIRGRMASLEMVSYMSGPLIGNAQAGMMASLMGTQIAITLGGGVCVLAILLCTFLLPQFWQYRRAKNAIPNLV